MLLKHLLTRKLAYSSIKANGSRHLSVNASSCCNLNSILSSGNARPCGSLLKLQRVSAFNPLQTHAYHTLTDHYSSVPVVISRRCESTKPEEQKELSPTAKLKRAVAEYGSTVIIFHITISLFSLGTFYILADSGLDVTGFLSKCGINNETVNKLASNAGTFALAYAIHKVFAPVRIGVTLTATPFIVRYFRKIGWLRK